MANSECTTHKELRSSQILKTEEDVSSVISAFTNLVNPFVVEDPDLLYCIASGAPATNDIAHELLTADEVGVKLQTDFVQERLVKQEIAFHSPIKKQNLTTFSSLVKSVNVSGKSKKTKQITAERNVSGQLVMLAFEHDIDMKRVRSYPLGPLPWAPATADGMPAKTDKAKLLHCLEGKNQVQRPTTGEISYIVDGNAVLQAMVSLPGTFGDGVFEQFPKAERVDFVSDSYQPLSIKVVERSRREMSAPDIVKVSSTKAPRDWKKFLSNAENKKRLSEFLLEEWQKHKFATKLHGRQVVVVTEGKATRLSSVNGEQVVSEEISELCLTQEEADTKIILHCHHTAMNTSSNSTIIVRSPDTDVLVLLISHTQGLVQTLLFDTGVGNKRRLIDIKKIARELGEGLCQALPALDSFTGCDTTSAFVKKGKIKPLKALQKHTSFIPVFQNLGQSAEVPVDVFSKLEAFTCILYGGGSKKINSLRHDKFQERLSARSENGVLSSYNGIDMSLLPPC